MSVSDFAAWRSGAADTEALRYNASMEREQLEEIVERVLTWPPEDQEKVARFVRELEELRAQDGDRISE